MGDNLTRQWLEGRSKLRSLAAGASCHISDGEFYELALDIAIKAHNGQVRKGSLMPYVVHPVRTAAWLMLFGLPMHVVAAGLLHDVLEDTPLTADDLAKACIPWETIDIVMKMTFVKGQKISKAEYLDRVLASTQDDAAAVKLADRLDNLRDRCADPSKFDMKKYLKKTEVFFRHESALLTAYPRLWMAFCSAYADAEAKYG
jgi:(p)ppGpp synthase/HD superfamily hydrolase